MKPNRILFTGILMLAGLAGLAASSRAGEWYDLTSIYGDLRFRFESIQTESNAGIYSYRDRQRVRARVGVKAQPDDYWKADFRLATDEAGAKNGDPISTNQTLGDLESKKPVWVDLAYIEYKALFDNGKLTLGKMNNPFETVGKSQLIWDADITPEGIAGNFNLDLMPGTNAFLNSGGFWIRESSSSVDPIVYGAQVGVKTSIEDIKIKAGAGYFNYVEITNQYAYDNSTSNTATASGAGNSLVNGKYANNFMLGEGFIEADAKVMDLPLKLYINYALNNGANEFNRGYIVGLALNSAKKEGQWEAGYNFRQLQKNAVVGAFSDSDFIGGGTNGEGHQLTAGYMITDAVKANFGFFRNRKNLDADINPFYNRAQVDVVLSF